MSSSAIASVPQAGDRTVNVLIGGEAGQGLVTLGGLLCETLARAGYLVHVTQDYLSRIRGGHNTYAIRFGLTQPLAPVERIDVLVALGEETIGLHAGKLSQGGLILRDAAVTNDSGLAIPFKELAGKEIFENVAALGVLSKALGLDPAVPKALLADAFTKKGQEIIDQNHVVFDRGYAWAQERKVTFAGVPSLPQAKEGDKAAAPRPPRTLIEGNAAIAYGALAAGCTMCCFYPMTPATSVALHLAEMGDPFGVVVEQAEDEIAAVNMAIGASFAGARPIVPTSGGGFALMVEGLSLAGIIEQPLVVVLGMRPGPATGLPTRTEQGELMFAIHAGHGEFPRAVFAPGSPEEAFRLTHRAFELAERFQTPVIILTDQYLVDSLRTAAPFDFKALPRIPAPLTEAENPADYARYRLTGGGVSPRLVPGFSTALVMADSDEHDELGHITEDHGVRVDMVNKRGRKARTMRSEAMAPRLYGPDNPSLLLVCWGSTLGAVLEAADMLTAAGTPTGVMHFSQVWPLNPDRFEFQLNRAGAAVVVESNPGGQFAGLLAREAGFTADGVVVRYDGLPMTARYVLDGLEALAVPDEAMAEGTGGLPPRRQTPDGGPAVFSEKLRAILKSEGR